MSSRSFSCTSGWSITLIGVTAGWMALSVGEARLDVCVFETDFPFFPCAALGWAAECCGVAVLAFFCALLVWVILAFGGEGFETFFFLLGWDFFAADLDGLGEAFLVDLGIPELLMTRLLSPPLGTP